MEEKSVRRPTESMRVQGWWTPSTFNVTDFMSMCLRPRFPSS